MFLSFRKIIEMLLLYGDKTEEFEDALKSNGEGEIEHVIEKKAIKYFTEFI
jgi:DNA primase